jgi:hypothetical protein
MLYRVAFGRTKDTRIAPLDWQHVRADTMLDAAKKALLGLEDHGLSWMEGGPFVAFVARNSDACHPNRLPKEVQVLFLQTGNPSGANL